MSIERNQRGTLREFRHLSGMTLIEASKRLDVAPATLSAWESGKSFPNVKHIRKIESLYGVHYDQIIFLV